MITNLENLARQNEGQAFKNPSMGGYVVILLVVKADDTRIDLSSAPFNTLESGDVLFAMQPRSGAPWVYAFRPSTGVLTSWGRQTGTKTVSSETVSKVASDYLADPSSLSLNNGVSDSAGPTLDGELMYLLLSSKGWLQDSYTVFDSVISGAGIW